MLRAPKRFVRILLALLLTAVCYLNFWSYSRQEQASPDLFSDVAKGTAAAPQQYRILVVKVAWFLHSHTPLHMRHAFALLDTLAAFVGTFVLLRLLEQSRAFRQASPVARWLGYFSYLFLCAFYLVWLTWYQRPETLPTACFIALMVLLLSVRPTSSTSRVGVVVATLAVAGMQAFIRADVSVCVYAGVALATLMPVGQRLPTPRKLLLPLATSAILLAAGVQWILMHRIYPHATYGDTAVFQLRFNLHPQSLLTVAVFAAPVVWTAWISRKAYAQQDAHFLALLLGAAIFLPLWATVGRIQEVRIFLPFALALAPLTTTCVLRIVEAEQSA